MTYTVYKGDTINEIVNYAAYPASNNTLYVAVRGNTGSLDSTATVNNLGYNVSIPTAELAAGDYVVYLYVNDNSVRIVLDEFNLTVKADFLTTSTGIAQSLSFARQALAKVEQQILACSAAGFLTITIAGRTTQRITLTELLKQRDNLLQEIELEEIDSRMKRGNVGVKPVLICFR